MNTPQRTNPYERHRFPAEIISHCVWLYFRFCLSYRDGEELLTERGVTLTDEAVRKWCRKFGQQYANQLRHRCPRPGDKWHLDEVVLTIQKARHYLWRAVDQDGNVIDILVQRWRDKQAAKKFFRTLVPGNLWSHRPALSATTASVCCFGLSTRDVVKIRDLARHHEPSHWSIKVIPRAVVHLLAS